MSFFAVLASILVDTAPSLADLAVRGYRYLWDGAPDAADGSSDVADATDRTVDGPPPPPAPPVDTAVPPLPAAWTRWNGARPELRGAPENTILALHGLDTTSPEFRAAFLDTAAQLGIPVDSIAVILSHESGFNPKALNPLPAAGIFQLTTGANLPGYTTKEEIVALADKTATEQLVPMAAFDARFGDKLKGANPGVMLLANFLPFYLGKPEDFVLATRPPELVGMTAGGAEWKTTLAGLNDPQAPTFRAFTAAEKYYVWNPGMDIRRSNTITVGDVYQGAADIAASAKGKRMRVDGSIWSPS